MLIVSHRHGPLDSFKTRFRRSIYSHIRILIWIIKKKNHATVDHHMVGSALDGPNRFGSVSMDLDAVHRAILLGASLVVSNCLTNKAAPH